MDPTEFGKKMDVKDLVAVHLTKYLPQDRTIRTLNSNFPDETLRNTVHFAINHPVENVGFYGNWDRTSYAVLAPLSDLSEEENNQVWNFNVIDTYFVGDVKLPKSSTVIASHHAYSDLIEQGIVDRDTLMSKFADERCPPKKDDQLIVEKNGIKYVILSWNSGNLREETYQEIARQGYVCMPGGQWNWGRRGAEQSDQKRIAEKIGATKTGKHCDDPLRYLEDISHMLVNMRSGDYDRREIDAYLAAREKGLPEQESEWPDDVYLGMRKLKDDDRDYFSHLPGLFKILGAQREIPDSYKLRLNRFLENNKARFREFIPPEVIQEFALPL